jgi:hypothetical protein
MDIVKKFVVLALLCGFFAAATIGCESKPTESKAVTPPVDTAKK